MEEDFWHLLQDASSRGSDMEDRAFGEKAIPDEDIRQGVGGVGNRATGSALG